MILITLNDDNKTKLTENMLQKIDYVYMCISEFESDFQIITCVITQEGEKESAFFYKDESVMVNDLAKIEKVIREI